MKDTVGIGPLEPPGNIAPGVVDLATAVDITWDGQPGVAIDGLPPGVENVNKFATGVLSLFAAARTLDPTSPDWTTVVAALTDNQELKNSLGSWNAQFQVSNPAGHRDQEIFFTTLNGAPANFEPSGTDSDGNPSYSLKSGDLYERRLAIGYKGPGDAQPYSFNDVRSYVVNDAVRVNSFVFTVAPTPRGGLKVVHMSYSIG